LLVEAILPRSAQELPMNIQNIAPANHGNTASEKPAQELPFAVAPEGKSL